ncbi:type II toxin-antitoxin system RelE/ParE family toxin, partial [Acinetobacter lwoffii]
GRPLRAFFAFDPLRQAIVLCIADKGGKKRFYKDMLDIADEQYQLHLTTLGDKSNG